MREPEFIPDWYRLRQRRGRRLRALARTTVAVAAVAVAWLTLAPGRAPAVGAPNVCLPSAPTRLALPAGAERTLRALRRLTAGGVVISSASFRDEAGATAVELRCVADDAAAAERFVTGVRGSDLFHDVIVNRDERCPTPDPFEVALHVRFNVTAGEAP